MTELYSYRKATKTIHEWSIETPCDAKTFSMNYNLILREVQKLKSLEYDDAFHVSVGDDEILFWIEVTGKEE